MNQAQGMSEDWLSVWIGLLIFVLSLGLLVGVDILGWVVTTGVWTDLSKGLRPGTSPPPVNMAMVRAFFAIQPSNY